MAWGRGRAAPKDPIVWGVGPVPTQPRSLSGGRAQTEALCRPAVEVRVRAGSPSSALGPPLAATWPGCPPRAVGTRAWGEAALPGFTPRERRKRGVRNARRTPRGVVFISARCPSTQAALQQRGLFWPSRARPLQGEGPRTPASPREGRPGTCGYVFLKLHLPAVQCVAP